ncbi:MAG: hypothetical protein ACJAYU_000301 [Bradymonadia bacterium]|jgi:hypothetical protein
MLATKRRRLRLTLIPALTLVLACGASQEAGAGSASDCAELAGSDAAIESAAACHAVFDAEPCRDAIDLVGTAGPAAVSAIAACVLSSGERSDGQWLADAIATATNDGQLIALGNQFGDTFETGTHGITFSASLDDEASIALGGVLADLEPEARDTIVSLALSYRMNPLAEYAAPYADDIADDDRGVRIYAEQLAASGDPLGEAERRVLIASGVWNAEDVLDCFSRELPGCQNWEGESPLVALAEEEEVDMGGGPAPNQALRLLRSGDIDPASATGLARIIGGAEYANRSNMMASMMLDMTDTNFPIEIRRAIALGATEPMCAYERLEDYLLRAPTSDPDRFENENAPWPTFVRTCAEKHWNADDLLSAVSAGSWLGVPRDIYDGFSDDLRAQSGGLSCDEYHAMGVGAYNRTPWVLMRGTAHVVVAELGGENCQSFLGEYVEQMADSDGEHPEARLAAVSWLLEQGDDSRCPRISSILDWFHDGYGQGPGPWAETLGDDLRTRCD